MYYDLIEEYMESNDICCAECGALFRVNSYGKLSCTNDWNHKTDITPDDIFSGNIKTET